MKKFLKFVLGVVILAGALYVCYLGYTEWYLAGGVSKAANAVRQNASTTLANAKNSIIAGAESLIAKNAADIMKYLGNQISSAGNSLAPASSTSASSSTAPSFFNNQVIPVSSSTPGSFSVPPPPVSLLTHVNSSVSISLVANGAYEVKWGDGTLEDGTASGTSSITVVSHSWKKPGDYMITVATGILTGSSSYSLPIRVLE
ncbi:PKD domain-containing protein [Patescibacteria group bacterium]|nr:PKD domain-containing protein [Patescibacteria group bacterium]MCL5114693.1 PKD domain-containing protein [Patescibacteria group bacterium]